MKAAGAAAGKPARDHVAKHVAQHAGTAGSATSAHHGETQHGSPATATHNSDDGAMQDAAMHDGTAGHGGNGCD